MARDLATSLKECLQFRRQRDGVRGYADIDNDVRKNDASFSSKDSRSDVPMLAIRLRECLRLRNRNQQMASSVIERHNSEVVVPVDEYCNKNSHADFHPNSSVIPCQNAPESAMQFHNNERNHHTGIMATKPLLEASLEGAWCDVELLSCAVKNGKFLVHYFGYGDKHVPHQLVRHRFRRAYDHDCDKFLEPGIDVAVYSTHPNNCNSYPAWYDGKLISIIRKVHSPRCRCEFEVQLYSVNEEDLLQQTTPRPLLAGTASCYHIDHLGILQKPFKGFSVIETDVGLERTKRVWSVDARHLSDVSIRLGNEQRELVAATIDNVCCRSVEDPLVGKVKRFKRARGVEIGMISGQQEEISLSKLLKVEDSARNQDVKCPSKEYGKCQKLKRKNMKSLVSMFIKEDGSLQKLKRKSNLKHSAEQIADMSIGNENKAYTGESFRPFKRRKVLEKARNTDQSKKNSNIKEGRMSLTFMGKKQREIQKIHVNPRKRRRLYTEIAHSRSIISSSSAHTTANAFLRTQKKYDAYREANNTREYRRKLQTLSSTIDAIILFKRRHWQRKLSILISRGLHNRDANAYLQQSPPQSVQKQTRVNTAKICALKRQRKRKRKLKKSQSSQAVKRHRSVDAKINDYKSSFNDFSKNALAKTPSGITKLDWSKLSLQNLANNMKLDDIPSRKLSSHDQLRRSPWKKHGQRHPITKAAKCNIELDDLSAWKDLRWLFNEPSRMKRIDIQYPDSVQLPHKPPKVPWDPIIFHEAPSNIDTVDFSAGCGNDQVKKSDPFEHLWHDMELSFKREKSSNVQKEERTSIVKDQLCCHDFILEQEEGLVCGSCGLISCSIEFMLPPTVYANSRQRVAGIQDDETELRRIFMDNQLEQAIKSKSGQTGSNTVEVQSSVWDLIPDLKAEMHDHQRDGFEFLWKNLVGSMGPTLLKNDKRQETGGCIISHAPGTGKTFLIISFLKSYMKLNPFCRPLILAPTIMLHPWQREFRKWKIDIPIHILNTSNDSRRKRNLSGALPESGEAKSFPLPSGFRISTKNMIDLHRMQVLAKWHEEESVLIASYKLFARLTDYENPRLSSFLGNIGKLLLNSAGLLILDEGHLARNHESKLRKSLKLVKTPLRILLSGTIFQNNCCELFNTFHLVRPTFMKDMFRSPENCYQDSFYRGRGRPPKGGKGKQAKKIPSVRPEKQIAKKNASDEDEMDGHNTDKGTEDDVESWARRLFMEKIGRTLENGQRKKGKLLENTINSLRSMTQSFVHYYTGEILKSLPGLKDFTILLKSSPVQERLLDEIAKVWDRHSTIEREYVVSCVCIHPYLFKDLFPKDGCSKVNLKKVGELVKDPQDGTKVRFIMELLLLCQVQNEKLLIFSQNITPLSFLEELLLSHSKILKGEHIKKLHGSLPLDGRQRIIDCFNKPNGEIRVLLASTKACGEGITLTGASRVVFLDIVWNPAVMKQAMSRAFRLGQKKEVFVYRLVASGTYEEDKYKRTMWKDWLSRSIFESSINHEKENVNATAVKNPVISKVRDPLNGLGELIKDDTMLTILLDHGKEDKSILRIVRHDSCLDHGDMCNSETDVDENNIHCV